MNCVAKREFPARKMVNKSELLGYEEVAFTGAKKGGRKVKFELPDGGTIFLDEIGDMRSCNAG